MAGAKSYYLSYQHISAHASQTLNNIRWELIFESNEKG